MAESLKVLLVEDDPDDAELIVRALRRAGWAVDWARVDTAAGVEAALASPEWEIVLSDHAMAGFDSQRTLELVRRHAPLTPFILVSGAIGEERAVDEMRHGAADFVSKSNLDRLEPVVRRALNEAAERAELERAERERARSDAQVRALFEHALDAIMIIGDDRRVLDANPAMSRLVGLDRDALVVLAETDLLLPSSDDDLRWQRLLETGEQHGESLVRHVDGALRVVDYVAVAHFVPGRHMIALRDMTERKAAEEALAQRHAQQAAVAALSREALVPCGSDDLMRQAVSSVLAVLTVERAGVIEILDAEPGFVQRAVAGRQAAGVGGERAVESVPALEFARAAGGPVVVEDWDVESRFPAPRHVRRLAERSAALVPIEGRDSRFGFLFATSQTPDRFAETDINFLAGMAATLAYAMQRLEVEAQIRHQALHDPLTGLPNRTLFLDRVSHALARTDRGHRGCAVFFIDLDEFKLVNDSLGHEAGDELLRLIAPRLAGSIRLGDTLARLGGDEFAVLCEEIPRELSATAVADNLIAALTEPFAFRGENHVVSASIGIAVSGDDSQAPELLRDADAAMYHAKAAGRGRAELFDDDMRTRVLGRVRTEAALRAALDDEHEMIYLQYQPLVSLRDGQIVGAEALARWRQPEREALSPEAFIRVAEESGLIHDLGAQLVRRAACECRAWQRDPGFAGIAINVSTRQLVHNRDVAALVGHALAEAGIPPSFLTLEITETALIEQLDAARAALESLRDLGVALSLDDFGTGYSSLSYLSELPFDNVKIDRTLIRDIVDTPRAAALAEAIVDMGHALGLRVIAEGVETDKQAALLKTLGCDVAQGFHFAAPMAPGQLTSLLRNPPSWVPPFNN